VPGPGNVYCASAEGELGGNTGEREPGDSKPGETDEQYSEGFGTIKKSELYGNNNKNNNELGRPGERCLGVRNPSDAGDPGRPGDNEPGDFGESGPGIPGDNESGSLCESDEDFGFSASGETGDAGGTGDKGGPSDARRRPDDGVNRGDFVNRNGATAGNVDVDSSPFRSSATSPPPFIPRPKGDGTSVNPDPISTPGSEADVPRPGRYLASNSESDPRDPNEPESESEPYVELEANEVSDVDVDDVEANVDAEVDSAVSVAEAELEREVADSADLDTETDGGDTC
jgi:hypothetical protein